MERQIVVNGRTRTYYVAGNPDRTTALLVFHGGGETAGYADDGILRYTGLDRADALVLSFQGQAANNGNSWLNAFPWLYETKSNVAYYTRGPAVPDDVRFVMDVLALYTPRRVFATGKSDGAGFVALLLDRFSASVPIRGAAVCSAALFYTSTGTVPLPSLHGVAFLAMHGTDDQRMPYDGAPFRNQKAINHAELWNLVDPSKTKDATHTAGAYAWLLRQNNGTSPVVLSTLGTSQVFGWTATRTVLIRVAGGGHDWFTTPFDATAVVLRFLGIPDRTKTMPAPYLALVPIFVREDYTPTPLLSVGTTRTGGGNGLGPLLIVGIVTLVLSVLFLIWSIVIIIRCGKNPDKKPLFDALITLLVLSVVFSWVPGLGQLLTLGLLITVIIGTVQCAS